MFESNSMISMLDNESQATLVNPVPTTTLVLSKPHAILNTTLLHNGAPYLKISTVDVAGAKTTVTNMETNQLLATIKRRRFHPDTVKFEHRYDGQTLQVKNWIQEGKMTDNYPKWTIRTPAGTFVWRFDVEHRFALCPENDLDNPVVWLQLATSEIPLALVLKRGTEGFIDEIVTSFFIVEHRLRMKEKVIERASGVALAESQQGGFNNGAY